MNAMQSLQMFWSGFGLRAYDEYTVPEYIDENGVKVKLEPPYITYEAANDFFGTSLARTASLWYRSSSWEAVTEKERQIADFIGRGGRLIQCDEGAFWVRRGTPWAQRMNDPSDDMIRRIVLNYEIEFII